MNKKVLLSLGLVMSLCLMYVGCGGLTGTSTQNYGVLMGTVKDTSGTGISAATVTVGSSSSTTNEQGYFQLSNLSASSRAIVKFSKTGYVGAQKDVEIATGRVLYVEAVMQTAQANKSLNATTGGTITVTSTSTGNVDGSVVIPANALEDANGTPYTGTAQVSFTLFDPTTSGGRDAFPGDYTGVPSGETAEVPIKSFGYANVEITDGSGNKLQLKSGSSAALNIPVPESLQSEAASMNTCALWYFDDTDGKWKEEGSGTYNAVTKCFEGTVTHFTPWNYDLRYPVATITGKVIDGNGDPVPYAQVTAVGNGWKSGDSSTGTDGSFSIRVNPGENFYVYASKGGRRSDNKVVIALATNETRDIGNIVLDPPNVKITLTWGANPRDLDSHLTIPPNTGSSNRGHLYFSYKGVSYAGAYPNAELDTDDTTSYGPEITSIYRLYNGTYRFCVHDYAGDSTISASDAQVELIIMEGSAAGIRLFSPPTGATAVKDNWSVFDLVVNSSGDITSVTTVGTIAAGVSHTTGSAFSPNAEATGGNPFGTASVRTLAVEK